MLFSEKIEGKRGLSILFKLSQEEKDFLAAEARSRGIGVISLLRWCIRKQLVENKKGGKHVENGVAG